MSEPDDSDAGLHHGGPLKREPDFVLRSNTFALPLSLLVLITTVAAVYYFAPVRKGHLMHRAVEEHQAAVAYDLVEPSRHELAAWAVGLLGSEVPWPSKGLTIIGARAVEIQKWRAGIVRYAVAGAEVSLIAQRARDAPPRKRRRKEGPYLVLSWRVGKWTLVGVGPAANVRDWAVPLGVPKVLLR